MSKNLKAPIETYLKNPIELPKCKEIDFPVYARTAINHIHVIDAEETQRVESYIHSGNIEGVASAFFVQQIGRKALSLLDMIKSGTSPKTIDTLGIYVNQEAFDSSHKDLMNYAVEHEIYEAWSIIVGLSDNEAHLAARQHQFNVASEDNKLDKIHSYYLQISPSIAPELHNAHRIAKDSKLIHRALSQDHVL
jgi:hypothetical protein